LIFIPNWVNIVVKHFSVRLLFSTRLKGMKAMEKQIKTTNLFFTTQISKALISIVSYPLTIVEAPMGYGKTTAIREHLKNADVNFLWQKVYDSTISGFWNGFCSLINELDSNCSHSLAQLGFPNDSVSLHQALKLIKDLELPKKTVLFIDDYHLVNETNVGKFIEFIVVNEIDDLHIVLAARFIDLHSMEELYLKGYLFHIKKEIFELEPGEITKYYKLCGISLKKSEADKLYSITEGWISALYLLMLNFKATGNFVTTENIYKLIEKNIFDPFSEDIKDFLIDMSIFDNFTAKQAIFIWGNENAENFLTEITSRNAFVNYDVNVKIYHIHSIFSNFLHDMVEKKDAAYKKKLFQKAGHWFVQSGEYFAAMNYFYTASDYENLLAVMEIDKGSSFGYEHKELIIGYFEECPIEIKERNINALLVYAMTLIEFNEMSLFQKICAEINLLIQSSSLDPETVNNLMGEMELLTSLSHYNDILGMLEHQKKACKLLNKPSGFVDNKGSWTFGSPSVLYLYYRESGNLEQEEQNLKEIMHYYYQLTSGHGMGADYVMVAERYFNQGEFENAEIEAYKALHQGRSGDQPNIVICALFLLARLKLLNGDYACVLDLLNKMHEAIEHKKLYRLMHTIGMCKGFVYVCLQLKGKIPGWLADDDYSLSHLDFPARAFSNIIYGRMLLLDGEYTKLLGIVDNFKDIASIFPNVLAIIYTTIYQAAANERIHRRGPAVEAIRQALDLAMPDKVLIPFVENCDYIEPLLEELYTQGIYRKDIEDILKIYKPYKKALEGMQRKYFRESKPILTPREAEIAQLAAAGFSNKGIGERLFVSENTVKTQLKSVFEKLDVDSRSLLKQYYNGDF